jgi:hypothetical protein
MEVESDNPAVSRQVIEMITVAHEYCLFFEKADKYSSEEVLYFFQKITPLLYLKGAMLDGNIEADAEYGGRFVTEEQWEAIFKTLREKFAAADLYYALDHNADSQQFSLADNMADIYQDLKDFVVLYQKAPMPGKIWAVAELQKLFESHWGPILLRALNAIHSQLFSENTDPEDTLNWE